MPDLMMIDVPDISAARAERVWAHVLETAAREHSRSKRRRAVGLSAAASSLAGALGFALLAPASSFASWTEVPTPIPVNLGDPRFESCLSAVTSEGSARAGSATLQPILGERRGDFTSLLVTSGGVVSMCISDQDLSFSGSAPDGERPRGETLSLLGNLGERGDGPRFVYGRIAGDVRGVSVLTDDDVRVTASVRDGYFAAWWPTSAAPVTVTATDESGAVLASMTPSEGDLS
jgi:hypothetical protein